MAENEGFATGYAVGRDANNGYGNGNGFFGGEWGWLLALLIFGGYGFGGYGGGGGAAQNYVLASDFATLQRQLSDGFGGVEKGIDTIRNGLCDGFYTEAQLINGVNSNIANLGFQLQQCCCDQKMATMENRYLSAQNTSKIENAICGSTRDIIDNQNANYRAIHDELVASKIDAKNEKIAEMQAQINALQLAASQAKQNEYLIGQLRPCPVPAYITCNPYAYQNGCGCGNQI